MLQKKKKISKERLLNVRGERRDADERGHPDQQQRRYGFIEEALVDIGRLLQNDSISARALGGACGTHVRLIWFSHPLLSLTLSLSAKDAKKNGSISHRLARAVKKSPEIQYKSS